MSKRKRYLIGALLLNLGGCMLGPDYQPPASQLPENWRSAPLSAGENPANAIERNWWQHFNDPLLNQLIEKVGAGNLDIKLAENRIVTARAARAASSAVLLPSGDMMASANRQQNQLGFPSSGPSNLAGLVKQPFNIFKSGFDASWELDLFGGHRRDVESAQAELEAAALSQADILVSSRAETAKTYFDIRLYQAQWQLAQQVLASDRQSLAIFQERYQQGDASADDAARAEAKLQHDQAQIAYYANLQAQAEYSLDLLLGAAPGTAHQLTVASAAVPVSPVQLVLAAPAAVIAQRPDIRYAERKLAAATAQQGAAVAKFFPDISLSGFVGLFNTNAGNFFSLSSKAFGMGANMIWPILSFGTLSANLDAADARQQEAMTQYQHSILAALTDVERAFSAFSAQEQSRQALAKEAQANRQLLAIAEERYQQGQTAYPEVLDAQRICYASENNLSQATAQTGQDLIAVYKRLGGGW